MFFCMKTKVALIRCSSYEEADAGVERALSYFGGLEAFVKKGDKVLLKTNQLMPAAAGKGVTTHPMLVAAVIRMVHALGAEAFVGDSPGGGSFQTGAKVSGIAAVCKELVATMVNLDDAYSVVHPRSGNHYHLSSRLKEFDCVINMPKLKTHSLTGLTGGVKNLMGCIPGPLKATYHLRFSAVKPFSGMLLDIAELVNPALTIMDGIEAMDGKGPSAGRVRRMASLIVSQSAVAVDTVMTSLVGFRPEQVSTQRMAQLRKIGDAFIENIDVVGDSLDDLRVRDFKRSEGSILSIPAKLQPYVGKAVCAKPVANNSLCTGCQKCKDICPNKAISMAGKLPVVDYSRCIYCYCCHEICPERAMELKKNVLGRLVDKIIG
jgi:uncharacterized protein (DUF362 family)/Pyruvate/2-oxoacid:ferredoxin oxidoreductase delta subunit